MKCSGFIVPEKEVPRLFTRTELPISTSLASATLYVTIAAGFAYLFNFLNWFLILANRFLYYLIAIGLILTLLLAILIARNSIRRKSNRSKERNIPKTQAVYAHQETLRKIDALSASFKSCDAGQEDTKQCNWSNASSQFHDILFKEPDIGHHSEHILSMLYYGRTTAEPSPDAVFDFRYPGLEQTLHIGSVELKERLELLSKAGFLTRQVWFETVACPACSATDPISLDLFNAVNPPPNRGYAAKMDKSHGRSVVPAFRCRRCSKLYSYGDGLIRQAFAYSIKSELKDTVTKAIPDFFKFVEVMKQHGLDPVQLATLKGMSGITHTFDIAVAQRAERGSPAGQDAGYGEVTRGIVINVPGIGNKSLGSEHVKRLYSELSDIEGYRGVIIAIHGMDEEGERLARHFGIRILASADADGALNEFWHFIRNEFLNPITRPSTTFGIEGFEKIADEFPSGRVYILSGPSGSMKTTVAVNYLIQGAKHGERGVMVVTGQSIENILSDFSNQGLEVELFRRDILLVDLTTQIEDLREKMLKGDASSVRAYLLKIVTDLGMVVLKHKAKRLVIDSIDDFWPDDAAGRDFIRGFILSLSKMGTTSMLTKTARYGPGSFSYGDSYVDGIINLGFQAVGDTRTHFIEALKIRGVKIDPSRFEIGTRIVDGRMKLTLLGRLPISGTAESEQEPEMDEIMEFPAGSQ